MKKGYRIFFSHRALKDIKNLKAANLDKICEKILDLIREDPFCYPPSHEKLYGDLEGLYSRRINRQHRLVYEVDESHKEIHIFRMWSHYE